MARREYKSINRRLQRGRLTSVNEGKYLGSIPPYGYRRIKIENDKGYTLEPEEIEAEIVRKIFNLFAYENISINGVASTLNKMQLKPRKADKWSISTVKDILNNPVYIGKIRWNARKEVISTKNGNRVKHRPRNLSVMIIDGIHQPIIEKETWDIVQKKRQNNAPPVVHNNIIKNPLVGIIFCQKCGNHMQRRPYKSVGKEPTLICNNPECSNISSKLSIVENKIIEGIKVWLKNYTIDYEKLVLKQKSIDVLIEKDSLSKYGSKLSKEEKRLMKVYECFEDGIYDKKEFIERSSLIKSEIESLNKKICKLKEKLNNKNNLINQQKYVIPKIKNVIDLYYSLETEEQKNMLLKSIIKKVTYLKNKKAIKNNSDPTDFVIHIYPKVPKN